MSKILKAVKKAAVKPGEYDRRLSQLGAEKFFAQLADSQIPEFDQLANSLIGLHDGERGSVVVFSAASSGEGNSFVSYHVARRLFALMGRPIAWVDANFLKPHDKIQDPEHNLRNLLQDPERWAQFPVAETLTLVPNGTRLVKTTDLLRSARYRNLLESFRDQFFITVIDAPPFLESVDVAHLATKADGLVTVVQSRGLKHEVINSGIRNLREHGVQILGGVLNRRVFQIPRAIYKRL